MKCPVTVARLAFVLITGGIVLHAGSGMNCTGEIEDEENLKRTEKNTLKAVFEVVMVNSVIWAYDRYVKKEGWAEISIDSVIRNIERGFDWDNNSFKANQFDHPLHGCLFWGAARVNGFNFWESMIFPVLGSSMWEFVLEDNRPSTNDTLMATFGGITLGEVLFRLSDLVVREEATGVERGLREFVAFFVNPIVIFDRLITGKSFRAGPQTQKHYYDLRIPVGFSNQKLEAGIDVEYKDATEKIESSISPYDYFTFDLRLERYRKRMRIRRIITSGFILGKKIKGNGLVGLFGDFDYVSIPGNRISAVGFGPGLILNFNLRSKSRFKTFFGFFGIFGGASSSFVLEYGEEIFRKHGEHHQFGAESDPYYLGPGIKSRVNLQFEKKNLGYLSAGMTHYWIHSIFGSHANEYVSRVCLRGGVNLFKWSQLGIEYNAYFKKGTYRDYDPLHKNIKAISFFHTFKF